MQIEWVGMTRKHFEPGSPNRVRMVVIHSTAGRAPGDLNWLRHGGNESRPVSVHYYIDKAGRTVQLVADADIAWHAGRSRWLVDGKMVNGCNSVSIGIELENLNTGRDPYPQAQYEATLRLTRDLVQRYNVPRNQLVRHLDIAPGRKTDPAGFPWEQFVADVYAEETRPVGQPNAELRPRLLDAAFRAAGGALPADWTLFSVAEAAGLGLPVAAVHGRSRPTEGSSIPDDHDRAVLIPGQEPQIIEIYARDLLAAPANDDDSPPAGDTMLQLSMMQAGALRDELTEILFQSADPVNGYRPDWAFHQFYAANAAALGAPIGPNHRLLVAPGRAYACQHFALDSLCSPIEDPKTILRLSELADTPDHGSLSTTSRVDLRQALLNDLYLARSGRRYQPEALLVRYAEEHQLGAPLGRPAMATLDGAPYLIAPYALDVLACRLPSYDWPLDKPLPSEPGVYRLYEGQAAAKTLGSYDDGQPTTDYSQAAPIQSSVVRRPSSRTHNEIPESHTTNSTANLSVPAAALGATPRHPIVVDVSLHALADPSGNGAGPEVLLVTDTAGPAAFDLRTERHARRWHYYVEQTGTIIRLCDESGALAGADRTGRRAVVIAVEGGARAAGSTQRLALAWLIRALMSRLGLAATQVVTFATPKPAGLALQPVIEQGDSR